MVETKSQTVSKAKTYRKYTDEEKALSLVALDLNQGNVNRTAKKLSIPRKTLAEWAIGRNQSTGVAKKRHLIGQSLADKLDDMIGKVLDLMEGEKIKHATFLELARTANICLDISLKLRGCTCGLKQNSAD